MKRYLSMVLGVFAISCGPRDGQQAAPYPSDNNNAVLDGATVGLGTVPNDQLRKELTVVRIAEDAYLQSGKAWITRGTTTATTFNFIAEISNVSEQAICFVRGHPVVFKDASDVTVATDTASYVVGTVARVSSGLTRSCLAPLQKGYLLDTLTGNYDDVVKVEMSLGHLDSALPAAPSANLHPRSYSVSGGALTINFENNGTATAEVDPTENVAILLDEQDVPLWFEFVADEFDPADRIVAAGSTGSVTERLQTFAGQSTRMQVFLNFEER